MGGTCREGELRMEVCFLGSEMDDDFTSVCNEAEGGIETGRNGAG
jgi:hypothetical protein